VVNEETIFGHDSKLHLKLRFWIS